jgi:hypothetical protein
MPAIRSRPRPARLAAPYGRAGALFTRSGKPGAITPAEPPHQRLPNGTGEASGGRLNVPRLWVIGTGTTPKPQVEVAAPIDLSSGEEVQVGEGK